MSSSSLCSAFRGIAEIPMTAFHSCARDHCGHCSTARRARTAKMRGARRGNLVRSIWWAARRKRRTRNTARALCIIVGAVVLSRIDPGDMGKDV